MSEKNQKNVQKTKIKSGIFSKNPGNQEIFDFLYFCENIFHRLFKEQDQSIMPV